MKISVLLWGPILLAGAARSAPMALSFTGQLDTPTSVFDVSFTLAGTSSIRIQTWGFGGGINAAGTLIPAGGFDPLVALFAGLPSTASIVTQAGNPLADADTLSNFIGNCPPAGTVVIGAGAGSTVCGDDLLMASSLPAGVYTLVLTDANYIPLAVNPGPPISTRLSDGFTDLTGGVFQTCNLTSSGTTCVTPTHNFAVDIVLLEGPGINLVPEPASTSFTAIGVAALIVIAIKRRINANV